MKNLVFLLAVTTFVVFYPNLRSQNTFEKSQEMQAVFPQDFSENSDQYMHDLTAYQILNAANSLFVSHERLEKFEELLMAPQIKECFLSIYASLYNENEKEMKKIYGLLHDEGYLNFYKKLAIINFQYFLETTKVLEEVIGKSAIAEFELPYIDIVEVNKRNINNILQSSRPVIIDCYTNWCGPCKYLAQVMSVLNQEYGDLYLFAKLNAEEEASLAKSFYVTGYPTILFIKDGKEVGRHKGFLNKQAFLSKINMFFND